MAHDSSHRHCSRAARHDPQDPERHVPSGFCTQDKGEFTRNFFSSQATPPNVALPVSFLFPAPGWPRHQLCAAVLSNNLNLYLFHVKLHVITWSSHGLLAVTLTIVLVNKRRGRAVSRDHLMGNIWWTIEQYFCTRVRGSVRWSINEFDIIDSQQRRVREGGRSCPWQLWVEPPPPPTLSLLSICLFCQQLIENRKCHAGQPQRMTAGCLL